MVLVHDTSSRQGLQVYKVSYRGDTICDGQTDRQTDGQTDARGKTICLPTLSGGDIMYYRCSENKGADQLRGYREVDLRL